MGKDDLLFSDSDDLFLEDEVENEAPYDQTLWKILIVDDEIEVHNTTRLVLSDFKFEGVGLEFLSAYSGKEALEILREHTDIAVVLLDVVMETPHAGLDCAEAIRNDLKNKNIRIVLRTGQPGQAPERKVIVEYDINDYKHKTELTTQRLFSTVYTAIRSYRDLSALDKQRIGLRYIIDASADFFQQHSIGTLAKGVLTQIEAMFSMHNSLYVHSKKNFAAALSNGTTKAWSVLTGTGKYGEDNSDPQISEKILMLLNEAVKSKKSSFVGEDFIGYFPTQSDKHHVIYLENCRNQNIEEINDLLTVFTNNVGIALDNAYLNEEIQKTQTEVIYRLGEVIETRSKETAYHVERVAEYSYIIGIASGMSEIDAKRLKQASPMHDIGKVGISDSILLKPDKLTAEEFEIMKTHTTIGYKLFKSSERKLLKVAANIAHTHHEHWDGNGYPRGIKGEEIPIEGRITNIVDVFDALCSERIYKKAWSAEDALQFLIKEKGKTFDPKLVDIFEEQFDNILKVKEKYSATQE
ncbi:response regulator [Maridesulfovibrio salexigens]|uniref:Response regulator receiver modulated metal dependent phosphohydrolase n=1 Tax=Maridesulfovibrio salexigens (strain ATCC 14822 / DSM 2638 / NCIMB 8403 / VKM B-1763) TaxID=526222 RepID=C6BRX9_MARSD|nr:response regulator [Maridesulfovibrio salexigens]ACS81362.1 response regulator receiver modulated metal dependent phosphohydrolase [Maridesulfovibrio salexigens DSM 2638]